MLLCLVLDRQRSYFSSFSWRVFRLPCLKTKPPDKQSQRKADEHREADSRSYESRAAYWSFPKLQPKRRRRKATQKEPNETDRTTDKRDKDTCVKHAQTKQYLLVVYRRKADPGQFSPVGPVCMILGSIPRNGPYIFGRWHCRLYASSSCMLQCMLETGSCSLPTTILEMFPSFTVNSRCSLVA